MYIGVIGYGLAVLAAYIRARSRQIYRVITDSGYSRTGGVSKQLACNNTPGGHARDVGVVEKEAPPPGEVGGWAASCGHPDHQKLHAPPHLSGTSQHNHTAGTSFET